MLPPPPLLAPWDTPYMKKRTINAIIGGFTSEGETSDAREVFTMNISTGIALGKRH